MSRTSKQVAAFLLASFTILACESATIANQAGSLASFEIVSGDGQEGPIGEELPEPLVVRAVDDRGKRLKDQLVNFRVVAGGGSMFAGANITDNDGMAQDFWTLGPEPGENVVEARAVDPTTGEKLVFARFTATALAVTTRFTDEAAFLAASGAAATVVFPSTRGLTTAPYVENGVTLQHAVGFNNRVEDMTPVLPGIEFGVSGAENIDITFDSPVSAFSLWMQDGFAVGQINAPGRDSQFEFTFKSDGIVLATLTEDPPIDAAFFLGVILSHPATHVEMREVRSVIDALGDPFNENDFFGVIYTK